MPSVWECFNYPVSLFFFFQFLVPNTFLEYRKKGGSKGEQEGFRSQLSHHCLIPKEIGKLQGKKKKKQENASQIVIKQQLKEWHKKHQNNFPYLRHRDNFQGTYLKHFWHALIPLRAFFYYSPVKMAKIFITIQLQPHFLQPYWVLFYSIKFIHFKCTTRWFLVNLLSTATITIN